MFFYTTVLDTAEKPYIDWRSGPVVAGQPQMLTCTINHIAPRNVTFTWKIDGDNDDRIIPSGHIQDQQNAGELKRDGRYKSLHISSRVC